MRLGRAGPAAIARHAVLLLVSALSLFPIYFMVSTSMKNRIEFFSNQVGFPRQLSLENFAAIAAEPNFLRWIANSLLLTLVSVTVALVVASLAAFALARMEFPGRLAFLRLMAGLMAVPIIVMIVPLYVFMVTIQLVNTYPAALIVYVGVMLPYMIFFLTGFFAGLPNEILEAGVIDGCSSLQLLQRIVVPLSAPALATMAIVNALWAWNELLVALVLLQRDDLRTLIVGLTVFRDRFSIDVPRTSAGLVIAILPMIMLYLAGQRYFARGLTMGAVKGD